MKIMLDRIISVATLLAAVVAIALVLKKPTPVAQQPQALAGIAASAQSSNAQPISQKRDQFEQAGNSVQRTQQSQASDRYFAAPQSADNSLAPPSPKTEAHSNADVIVSSISQTLIVGAVESVVLLPDSF